MRPTASPVHRSLRAGTTMLALFIVVVAAGAKRAATGPATRPIHSARPAPRVELSEAEYKTLAEKLRAAYALPADQWPAATIDPGVEFHELGKLPPVVYPPKNPYSKEKETLGRELFFDPRLSGSAEIACASCHDPDLAWADGRTTAFGHGRAKLRRNAPSVLFAAYASTLFWDGRSGSLEDQASQPILAHDEMDGGRDVGIKRLNAIAGYREQFKSVFGNQEVTLPNAAKAIATFERTLATRTGRSLFDKFVGGKTSALSDSAVRGLHLFRTEARCINCHSGAIFSDNNFHDIGLSYYGRKLEDLGRFNATNEPKDVGKFRTPILRNVARTRPYMHNGLFELEGLINSYNAGMPTLKRDENQTDDPLFPTKDALLKPLGLNEQDREDLLAFLQSLSEPLLKMQAPPLPDDGKLAPTTKPAMKDGNEG